MDARSDLPLAERPSSPLATATGRVPPQMYFVASALFHYLGPAFAVLLFARVEPLGVAWLRIASAALIFAAWRRPWRHFRQTSTAARWNITGLGVVLGGMNACFYLAIARLPLATVGVIEFLGPIALALAGLRTRRNTVALALVIAGVWCLTHLRLSGTSLGFVFAFANCALFTLYIVLGHRVANDGGGKAVDRLAAAMLVALVVVSLIGIRPAMPAMLSPVLLAAGMGVGVISSVIPYVCDQLAMARLPRASFATLLALLPATACLIGVVVLHQLPGRTETIGIALVAAGIAIHHEVRR